jgi:type II secretory pathway predicted ATPase ExeA
MNAPTNPPDLQLRLKTLWGAAEPPFSDHVKKPVAAPGFTERTARLEQLVAVRASGVIHGPNGVGKTLSVEHFLRSLPEKRFKTILISHSSVTGTDLLRLLCTELGRTPRMRRGDNLQEIRQAWQQLDRLWPVPVLEEAQNFSATALEEIRLLSCDRRQCQLPFSLVLVGDSHLLPRLQMGINAALLARLGFCLPLHPWSPEQVHGYIQARLEEVGIHSSPFEEAALQLLVQAANGLPRAINHLAQRAIETAATENSRTVTTAHLHRALELLPWVAKLS